MKNEKDTYELIEKYLDNSLSGSERAVFEQQLQEDPSLAQELETHRAVHDLIIDQGLLDLKQKMRTGNFEKSTNTQWKIYTITGAIILLGIGTAWFFSSKTTKNIEPISIAIIKENRIEQPATAITSDQKTVGINKTDKTSLVTQKSKEVSTNESKQVVADQLVKADSVSKIIKKETPQINPATDHATKADVLVTQEPKAVSEKPSKTVTIEKLPESKSEPRKETNNEFLINPSFGQVWEFPIQPGDNCELKIMNRNGDIIFRTNINNGYPNAWNGLSQNGNEITMGTYLYFITYSDGKMEKGFITVSK